MKKLLVALCGGTAALALFGIMALTFVDVAGRKLFDHSLPGALEVTELLMVAVIFASMPLVSLRGEHVVFDSLDAWLPRTVRRVQAAAVDGLCALALAGLAWVMWSKAGQMAEFGDTTAQLKLAVAPFVRAISALLALTALVHAVLIVRPDRHGAVETGAA